MTNPWIEQNKLNEYDDSPSLEWLGKDMIERANTMKSQRENLKIKLPIGTRATLETFIQTYTRGYLANHGIIIRKYNFFLDSHNLIYSAFTKYGEIILDRKDIITYVGKGKWSVTKYENNQVARNDE